MQVSRVFIVILIAGLFFITPCQSQVKCVVEKYSTANGLSHDGVMDIHKGNDGYMWFGTWDGINRFDGVNFVTYKARAGDKSKLGNNRIEHIEEDHLGYLWSKAYDNQIYRFDKKKEAFLSISEIIKTQKQKFVNIIPTKDHVWLTTLNHGIYQVVYQDSVQFKLNHYSASSKTEAQLPSNTISFIHEQKNNNVWIGTAKGLLFLELQTNGTFKSSNILSGTSITAVAEGDTQVWFTTDKGVLLAYDKTLKSFKEYAISNQKLQGVCVSKKEQVVFVSTANGKVKTVNCNTGKVISEAQMPGKSFFSIYEDKNGLLWLEPEFRGVVKLDVKTGVFKYFVQKNDASFQIFKNNFDVFEDKFGRVWTCMKGGGFGYYNQETDEIGRLYDKTAEDSSLAYNIITSKYLDASGVLWLNTNDRGINKVIFQEEDFKHQLLFDVTDNKTDNEIRGLLSDSKQRLWMASKSDKLVITKNGKPVSNPIVNWPKNGIDLIYVLFEDSKGNIWFGTKGNGLFRAKPLNEERSQYTLYSYKHNANDSNSISGNKIYSILEDKYGRIWVGNYGKGINLITEDNGEVQFKNVENCFQNYPINSCNLVRHLFEDSKGKIWISTTNGLLVAQPTKDNLSALQFETYRKVSGDSTSIGSNDILFVQKDSNHTLWVSSAGGGLSKVIERNNTIRFKTFTSQNGLPSDFILSMVEDNHKNLWLATENGISKFNLNNYSFRNFDAYDGLYKTGFSESSSLKLPDNNLLFGCIKGYLIFNPEAVNDIKIPAAMSFSKLEVNNEEVFLNTEQSPLTSNINYSGSIHLNYNQNTIGLNYQVLDYRSNKKQTYAYRLKGIDKEWHNVNNQTKATYTNLAPGDYELEVKCVNPELYTNTPSKSLAISIAPPFWKTTWAYGIYIVLVLLLLELIRRIVFSMIRLRNKVALEQKLTELKLNFFTNISHELRTPLTLIVNPIEEIAKDEKLSPRGEQYIEVVRKNTKRMVRFVNQLLDFRKIQSGKAKLNVVQIELISFVNEIASLFSEAAYEKQIDLKIITNTDKLFVNVDAKKIDIVVYNLLSNAFKFSPNNTTITLEVIKNEGDAFTIRVIDQGIGVDQDKLKDIFKLYFEGEENRAGHIEGTGIGLALSKEYIKLHKGKIFAENNKTKGLTVTLKLNSLKVQEPQEAAKLITTYPLANRNTKPSVEGLELKEQSNVKVEAPASAPQVLIVEDNNELRRFLVNQLRKSYRILEAANGAQGFEKAKEHVPDLILSDIMMPVMDGIEFLDKVKNTDATSHIPIVLLTAKTTVETKIEALEYGADFYITKPFDTSFLKASIKNLIENRKKLFDNLVENPKTLELAPSEIVITTKDEAFLKNVIAEVEQQMENPKFNIDALANAINMPRATFNRKFKSLTNMTAVEFVRDMRLKRAKQLLDAGESNVSEVAFDVGFNSAGYFSTCFREKYNMSPKEYLKNHLA